MKRIAIFLVLLLCGCSSKSVLCSYDLSDNQFNYNLKRDYIINYKGKYVKKVTIDEEISTKDSDMLKYFKESNEAMYSDYQERYKSYTYDMKVKDKNITSHIDIDFKNINYDEYLKDNSEYKKYYDGNNNYQVKGLIKNLENMGASCK